LLKESEQARLDLANELLQKAVEIKDLAEDSKMAHENLISENKNLRELIQVLETRAAETQQAHLQQIQQIDERYSAKQTESLNMQKKLQKDFEESSESMRTSFNETMKKSLGELRAKCDELTSERALFDQHCKTLLESHERAHAESTARHLH